MVEVKSYMGNSYEVESNSRLEGILQEMEGLTLVELKELLKNTEEAILDLQILETLSIIESNEA